MPDVAARRLLLMRHAKAEAHAANDHGRDLTDRGRRDARAAGGWLADQDLVPSYVLVSSAARALTTWTEVSEGLSGIEHVDSLVLDSLYGADADQLIAECALHIPSGADTALVIGHNPTIETAAGLICDASASDESFPTSALAVIELGGAWSELGPGGGSLVTLHTPRG